MATGTRGTNTMSEGLRKLLSDISDMKLSADADLPFLINLETMILGKLKGQADDALGGGGAGGMGGPQTPMGAPMAAPPPGMGQPQMVPGVMQGPPAPNPDELRRILTRANTAHRLNSLANQVTP